MTSTEQKIMDLLNAIRPEYDFTDSDDFIEDGLLDSFDVVTLVSDLEDAFEIIIDGLDVIPGNFASLKVITETLKKNGGAV